MADSVKTLDGFSPIVAKTDDSVETLDGFSNSSREETLGGLSLVQSVPNPNGSLSVFDSVETLDGHCLAPSVSNPNGSLSVFDSVETLDGHCLAPSVSNPNGSLSVFDSVETLDGHCLASSVSNLDVMETLDDHSLVNEEALDDYSLSPFQVNPKVSSTPILAIMPPPPSKEETLDGSSHEEHPHSPMHTETNPMFDYEDDDYDDDGGDADDDSIEVYSNPNSRYFHRRHHPDYWFYERRHEPRWGPRWDPGWDSRWPDWSHRRPPHREPGKFDVEATGVGAGLRNMGNTCFINAILQCFMHTVPLVQGLRSYNHASPCDCAREGFCVICALRDYIELSFTNSGWMISPSKLVENLNYFSSSFQRHQQEDAHEFLQCLLDKLERCCLDSKTKDESLSSQDVNLVQEVFGGRLVSKLQCCTCGHCSDTYEPLIDLSLEIDDVDTLPCALESFTKVEKIDDPEMKFTCENCKEKVSVEKQLMLDQAPSVAAFHLKRFKTDGSSVVKIHKHVEFPLELDLQLYASGSQNSDVGLKYQLYAIVVHIGVTSTSGHYFCYIRSSPDTWHRLDDDKVNRVEEEFVLSQDAYILFYARQGTPWFSSSFEVQKPCFNPDISNSSPKSVLENMDSDSASNSRIANIDNGEANESREVGGTSTQLSFGTRHEGVTANETVGTRHEGVTANETGTATEEIPVDFNEFRTDVPMMDAAMPLEASDGTLHNEKSSTICSPENYCYKDIDEAGRNGSFHTPTPPKSPSPDVCLPSRKEGSYHIPRNHLKVQNRVSCKKPLKSAQKDSQKIEAFRYVNKNMSSSRGVKFMAAMLSRDDGSPSKRKTIRSSPCKRGSPSARRKHNHVSVMHRVAVLR